MFEKQLEEIKASEKFYQQIGQKQVNTNSLKEDFHVFDIEYGKMLAFEHRKQPQDIIFDLIKDRKERNSQEVDELQRRVKIFEMNRNEKDILREIKEQYLAERSSIVDSGLTVWDLRKTFENDIQQQLQNENDDFSKFLRHFLDKNESKNIFLWELMDETILNLGKTLKCEKENAKTEDENQLNEIDKEADDKMRLMEQLFRELNKILDFENQSHL